MAHVIKVARGRYTLHMRGETAKLRMVRKALPVQSVYGKEDEKVEEGSGGRPRWKKRTQGSVGHQNQEGQA